MNKSELRKKFKYLRKNMRETEVREKSDIIVGNFLSKFKDFETYFIYCSFDNEVRTIELIDYLYKRKKKVYLPILSGDMLNVGEFDGFHKMVKNNYGILEPVKKKLNMVQFDVVVVPGLAFDKQLFRLGFGKGYYDRFLKSIEKKICIGFAYDFQVVEKLPVDKHDVKLDLIITERRMIGGE